MQLQGKTAVLFCVTDPMELSFQSPVCLDFLLLACLNISYFPGFSNATLHEEWI